MKFTIEQVKHWIEYEYEVSSIEIITLLLNDELPLENVKSCVENHSNNFMWNEKEVK